MVSEMIIVKHGWTIWLYMACVCFGCLTLMIRLQFHHKWVCSSVVYQIVLLSNILYTGLEILSATKIH